MSTTISALANETLCEIFQYLSHSCTVNQWYKQTLPSLRLVSRHWNDVIEAFPMLWTSILITEKSVFQYGRSPFQTTRMRLSRSLQLPIKIYFNLTISSEKDCFNNTDAFILAQIIRGVTRRITSIEMIANSHSRTIQRIILSGLDKEPLPLLRSFTHADPKHPLTLDDGGYFQNPSSILQYQGTPESRRVIGSSLYPSLVDLNLAGVSYNLQHIPVIHGLRRLRITAQPLDKRPSINQMLEILFPARDTLVVLQLEDVIEQSPTDSGQRRTRPIIFKNLKILSFGYYDSAIAQMVMESVRVPALVDLTLTCTIIQTSYPNRRSRLPEVLIKHFPLHQIQQLALNNVMFPPEGKCDMGIFPPTGEEMSEAERKAYEDTLQFSGFQHIMGYWRMPLFMYFLSKFSSLRNLHLDEIIGLKKMMGAYWRPGTLQNLGNLCLDGCPEGLFELVRAVEDLRKEGNRPLRLRMSIHPKLMGVLSEEEKARLERHCEELAGLYVGPPPKPVSSQRWICRVGKLPNGA